MVLPGDVINPASGVMLLALGIWIARRGPRNVPTRALAGFAGSFGAGFVVYNAYYDALVWLWEPFDILDWVANGLLLTAGFFLLRLAANFPRPLEGRERRFLLAPALTILLVAALWWPGAPPVGAIDALSNLADGVFQAACWGVAILFAIRYARATDASERRTYVLLSAALLMYPAYYAGYKYVRFPVWDDSLLEIARRLIVEGLATFVLLAALWLRNTQRAPRDASASARNLAILCIAAPLASIVLAVALGAQEGDFVYGLPGISRTATVLILAYAILRHQLLGLDLKVRWTISKGTVAAAFVAIFFVATEIAQELFSDTWGSLFGVAAAGALVFALAPLQHAAERLARKAVPLSASEAAEIYKAAVRAAVADGRMTSVEEEHLADVQEKLSIAPRDALRLRREVEESARV